MCGGGGGAPDVSAPVPSLYRVSGFPAVFVLREELLASDEWMWILGTVGEDVASRPAQGLSSEI